jgi:hypothetical protein
MREDLSFLSFFSLVSASVLGPLLLGLLFPGLLGVLPRGKVDEPVLEGEKKLENKKFDKVKEESLLGPVIKMTACLRLGVYLKHENGAEIGTDINGSVCFEADNLYLWLIVAIARIGVAVSTIPRS